MISLVARSEGQPTVPQLSSFTRVKQNSKFTAGRVVSIERWSFLSAGAQQWSGHGSGLQIIGGSFLYRYVRGPRFAHNAGGRPVLKTACCLRRSRAPSKKREACFGGDEANPDRCFRISKIHGDLGALRWVVDPDVRNVVVA